MRRKHRRRGAAPILILLLLALSAAILTSGGEEQPPISYSGHNEPSPAPTPAPEPDPPASPEDALPEPLRELYDRVPEARDFLLGTLSPQPEPDAGDIDLSGLDLTDVPELYQWDTRWAYARYAGNYLGLSGCGPTALSMAAIYLTGDTSLNPLAVAEYAEAHGYAVPGDGTAWTLFSQGAAGLGLKSRELPLVKGLIDGALSRGELVALILGPGDFTDSGHYILLTGITEEGYTIRDPNDPAKSACTWTYSALESQIRNIWALTIE